MATLWVAAIALGMFAVLNHSYTPGDDSGVAPQNWPVRSGISVVSGKPTLVMFVHPKCPCTRASVNELAILMTRCQDRVNAHVMVVNPTGVPADWPNTSLVQSARRVPGVAVGMDDKGREARLFGANTSGLVVLYDGSGRLLFSGGITGARGHEGDNDGLSYVVGVLHGEAPAQAKAPAFGCSLFNPESMADSTNLCKQPVN